MTAHAHDASHALAPRTPAARAGSRSLGLGLPVAVYALVIASFAMGADEFIVAGVIEEIALALGVSLGAVGLFESAYALGVAIGAPLFVAIGSRLSRRFMLLLSSVVFVGGNLLSALGPTYETILAGRLVAAMGHGSSSASRRSLPPSSSIRPARAVPLRSSSVASLPRRSSARHSAPSSARLSAGG